MSGYIGPYYMIDNRVDPATEWGATDMNRITGATKYVQDFAKRYGYHFDMEANTYEWEAGTAKTWTGWWEVYHWLWQPLADTLLTLGQTYISEIDWNPDTAWDISLTVSTANALERALLMAWDNLQGIDTPYTGQTYAGGFIG